MPHCVRQKAVLYLLLQALLNKAIEAALAARKEWDLKPVADRAQVFLKAADMLSGPRRAEVLAKTMVGQVRMDKPCQAVLLHCCHQTLADCVYAPGAVGDLRGFPQEQGRGVGM